MADHGADGAACNHRLRHLLHRLALEQPVLAADRGARPVSHAAAARHHGLQERGGRQRLRPAHGRLYPRGRPPHHRVPLRPALVRRRADRRGRQVRRASALNTCSTATKGCQTVNTLTRRSDRHLKDPKKQNAAWEFIRFLASPEIQTVVVMARARFRSIRVPFGTIGVWVSFIGSLRQVATLKAQPDST
ncbi:hypothetical protein MESS2_1010021 [Mesorhizobium metallidurans STM 2683]|uniref:Extracellular solute-binding protein n=1 Tax=Mesorhizobium metallidurans STM 2683 TaxID=1297569 RepID=M5EFM2_9HYPH|nr:hypothetical protein MESS2_1010021 [Mesorhizobium metallidurans STM 2683]